MYLPSYKVAGTPTDSNQCGSYEHHVLVPSHPMLNNTCCAPSIPENKNLSLEFNQLPPPHRLVQNILDSAPILPKF